MPREGCSVMICDALQFRRYRCSCALFMEIFPFVYDPITLMTERDRRRESGVSVPVCVSVSRYVSRMSCVCVCVCVCVCNTLFIPSCYYCQTQPFEEEKYRLAVLKNAQAVSVRA